MKIIITTIYFLFFIQLHLVWNQKERKWLNNLQSPLRVGITQIPDQVLKIDKNYRGFSIDFFKKIESLLDIKFQFVYFETWNELVTAGKNRDIDIIFSAQKTGNVPILLMRLFSIKI